MRRFLLYVCLILMPLAGHASVPVGSEAQYYVQSACEGQTPPLTRVRIVVGKAEKLNGKTFQWWEMTLERRTGGALGIKVLSERVPMTSDNGVGEIVRYIVSLAPDECLEYVDALSGKTLLPQIRSFRSEYLPHTYNDARYSGGFANSGRLLGHSLVRYINRPSFPNCDFLQPKVLRLRSDLRIGLRHDHHSIADESIPKDKRKWEALNKDEYAELIAAGANYVHPYGEAVNWVKNEPVYWYCAPSFPDDFYRSNFMATDSMFIDEPGIRFGWDEGVPGTIISPDIYANSVQMRVEEMELPRQRLFNKTDLANLGAMSGFYNPRDSWDTCLTFASCEQAGGAPCVVFEGRYVKRGYGWVPEILLGESLSNLADKQQYDYFDAFMRGASRRNNAYWGTSVYPEGDPKMMLPAMVRAYDQGARNFWFWHDNSLDYKDCVRIIKGLSDHIKAHPRTQATTRATTAIVIPKGYVLNEFGVFGMNREAPSEGGASYGDISAAATFQGILCSRAGVEYDYVNDYSGITKAGYKQLIYVREDGKLDFVPQRKDKRAPKGLSLSLKPKLKDNIVERMNAKIDFVVSRSAKVAVDGNIADWSNASWITMSGEKYLYGDNYKIDLSLKIPETATPKSDQKYLGFTWDGISDDYRAKYHIEGWQPDQVVVTSILPNSAASAAGLREGDVIYDFNNRKLRWGFELWGFVDQLKKSPGADIKLKIKRPGLDHVNGPSDLSARVAYMLDDKNLYFAADVTDDVQVQTMRPCDFWMNDSIQIGFDPTMLHKDGYGENEHEIGFGFLNSKPIAYRWQGRRGQAVTEMKNVPISIKRVSGRTIYEAAIPLSELAPLSPDMWRQAGMCVVINDSDDGNSRKARLELATGAMTAGKKLNLFPVFEFEPSKDQSKVSAAIIWNKRSLVSGGSAEITIAVSSPKTTGAKVVAKLTSLDDPATKPVISQTKLPITLDTKEFTLKVSTQSPPGRYRLTVEVIAPNGTVAAKDSLPVYVYR